MKDFIAALHDWMHAGPVGEFRHWRLEGMDGRLVICRIDWHTGLSTGLSTVCTIAEISSSPAKAAELALARYQKQIAVDSGAWEGKKEGPSSK